MFDPNVPVTEQLVINAEDLRPKIMTPVQQIVNTPATQNTRSNMTTGLFSGDTGVGDTYRQSVARNQEMNSLKKSSLAAAQLGGYGAYINAMGMAGGMLGQGLGKLAGGVSPQQQAQNKLDELMKKHPNPKTYEEYMALSSEFMTAGMTEMGEKFHKMAQDMKTTKTANYMTPDMKNIRDKAQFELGCDINDPAIIRDGKNCYQLATDAHKIVKRVGTIETGEIEGVKNFQTAIGDVLDKQHQLRGSLATLRNLKKLSSQVYTGMGSGFVEQWNRFGTVLNLPGATNEQAALEAFRSGGLEVAMTYIHNTKGAVSDMEMAKFIEASPNLRNTELGNRLIIAFAIAKQEQQQKLNYAMSAFGRKNKGATMNDWLIEEDRLMQTKEYNIADKVQSAYDAAINDPKYTGLTTDVETEGDASTDIDAQIDKIEQGLK